MGTPGLFLRGGAWITIAFWIGLVLAIGGTVCLYIFVLSKKSTNNRNKFLSFLRNFLDFRYLILEKALKALYIFCTAFLILYGLLIVWVNPGLGLILLFIAPVVLRLTYECLMMFVLLVKNTMEINGKLKDQTPDETPVDLFDVPLPFEKKAAPAPAEEAAPVAPVIVEPAPATVVPPVVTVQPEPAPAPEPIPEPAPEPAAPAAKFCPNCGNKLLENDRFCTRCGEKL